MVCPKCGKEILESATFCTGCGWKTPNREIQEKKSRTVHNGGKAAAVLAVIFVIIYILIIINAFK